MVVLDATDPKFSQKAQITENILFELYKKREVTPPPTLYLLNKTDLPESRFNVESFPKKYDQVCISAKTGAGKELLLERIETILSEFKKPVSFLFPHEEGGRLSLLYKNASVGEVRYEAEGIYVDAICDEKTRGALAKFIKKD